AGHSTDWNALATLIVAVAPGLAAGKMGVLNMMGRKHQDAPAVRPTLRRGIFQGLLLAAIMFSSLAGYLFVLNWRGNAATVVTFIPWDEWLPFWPSWIWLYLIPYAIGPILAGALTPATFWWFIRYGLLVVGLALTIFVVFP